MNLLPALPDAWDEASVAGLRARGGYELDIEWDGGSLTEARLRASRDGFCRIRVRTAVTVSVAGEETEEIGVIEPDTDETLEPRERVLEFPVDAGREYVVRER